MMRFFVFALAVAAAAPVRAQELFPRFSISAGAWDASFATDVRVAEEAGGEATSISLEDDLALPEERQVWNLGLQWSPAARHELGVTYRSADRSGFASIDREIVFRGTVYPVQAETTTGFATEAWELTYTWWAMRRENVGFGPLIGVATIALDASVVARAPGATVTITEAASTDVPVAMIGAHGRAAFGRRVFAEARAGLLPRVTLDDYSGRALTAAARLEVRLLPSLGIGVGYHHFEIEGTIVDPSLEAELDLRMRGPEAFVRLTF